MTIVKVVQYERPFVQIDKRVLDDARLSWKAKGLLVYLLGKPDDWRVRIKDLVKKAQDGDHAVRSALKELQEHGYAEYSQERTENGTYSEAMYVIREVPHGGFRDAVPYRGFPHADNRALTNNELTNNENSGVLKTKEGKDSHDKTHDNGEVQTSTDRVDETSCDAGEGCPPKIVTGTGDTQLDAIDTISAGQGTVQAKEILAQEMYRVLWPTLEWPTGKGKTARDARAAALRSADRVLARIGHDNYQDALDACHMLLVDPTQDEMAWLDKAKTIYALVDTVTSKVNELRKRKTSRERTVEMNKRVQETETYSHAPGEPDEPHDQLWSSALDILQLQMAQPTYEQHLSESRCVAAEDGRMTVMVSDANSLPWVNGRLRPIVERTMSTLSDEPIEVEFVGPAHVDT